MSNVPPIKTTIEWWKSEKEWVKYNTDSTVSMRDGSVEIRIRYAAHKNTHIKPDEICWGEAIIKMHPSAKSGEALWVDDEGSKGNGRAKWRIVDIPLVGEKKKETVSRLQRQQEQFRLALIACDEGTCVLSGETTLQALEAAHIIPASLGGSEVIENGILLRADLHRIFDSKIFEIGPEGKIAIKMDIGKAYMDILKDTRLPVATFERVKEALEYMANVREGV